MPAQQKIQTEQRETKSLRKEKKAAAVAAANAIIR